MLVAIIINVPFIKMLFNIFDVKNIRLANNQSALANYSSADRDASHPVLLPELLQTILKRNISCTVTLWAFLLFCLLCRCQLWVTTWPLHNKGTFTWTQRKRVESEIWLTEPDVTALTQTHFWLVWTTTAHSVKPRHQHFRTGLLVPAAVCNSSISWVLLLRWGWTAHCLS